MDEKENEEIKVPEIVEQTFNALIERCEDTSRLEEKKQIQSEITIEENIKVYNLLFGTSENYYGFTFIGNKKAINTYDITDIQFLFAGPKGIAHKRLTNTQKNHVMRAFELKLLENNFDINTYKYIPEY